MKDLLSLLQERPLIFDGAMGTMIQGRGLTAKDYGGHAGCYPFLNLTCPAIIGSIHQEYLGAGADIITTNTFGASPVDLGEHGLVGETEAINEAAVKIAKEAAQKFSRTEKPRFVAGELGPTSKLPTFGHIGFEEMFSAYKRQALALLKAGADLIVIATSQDILQVKAAAAAARRAMEEARQTVPLFVSVTIEPGGRMLLGSDIIAALATTEPYCPDAFGINCATGPEQMEEHLRLLAGRSPFPILCRPNAGLPENKGGKTVYRLAPKEFADELSRFVREINVAIVGGCCGTTPKHIRALAERLKDAPPPEPIAQKCTCVSSLFSAVSLDQEPKPFLVAEQTNANGSKKFREMLLQEDYEGMVALAKQAAQGAHALDVCVAFAGRDEIRDMTEVISRLVKAVDSPLMIDSTNPQVIEAALALAPGRCLINSINLEDGGRKAKEILKLAKIFGAAVVCLTIDEEGMAHTAQKKLEVARRLHDLARSYGLRTEDLLFDVLTLTVASGDAATADAAVQTLQGVKRIKEMIKGARTSLGVSNVSFGLPAPARKVVTSLFFHQALKAGLDAAIVNPVRILRLSQIPEVQAELARRLLDNDTSKGPPLSAIISYYENEVPTAKGEKVRRKKGLTAEEELRQKIIDGDKNGLDALLTQVLKKKKAAAIINKVLLPAMQEVGELFGQGRLPLPFVLQSAETMRQAIDQLSPQLQGEKISQKGTIVLATVRGDVHDIGKNLVDIILSHNGFEVINLGIRQPVSAIKEAALKHKACAIGLSGLLVSSTEVMRQDLEVLKQDSIDLPVLVGGAALTKKYTDNILRRAYGGPVYYCKDAFAGLMAMKEIAEGK